MKQEAIKNRNICSSPISLEHEQDQAPIIREKEKMVLEKQSMFVVQESQTTQ